ncbi:MAG: SH3 domain-containing protein [Waterburya sp.]
MFKTLLASVLIVGATLPAAAQVGPGLGSSDYANRRSTVNYGRICTSNSNGRLSMRTGPGQGYGKILEMSNNQYVPLNFGEYSSDGFWWWNVNYHGYSGWARADYICEDPQ